MKHQNYLKYVRWSTEDNCFIGSIPDLCGDCCHADTELETYRQLIEIEQSLIELYQADGKNLPPVTVKPSRELAFG